MVDTTTPILQSFRDKAFGLTIAESNVLNRPTSRTAFAELTMFNAGTLALTLNNKDRQDVILQIALNYPAGTGDTAITAMATSILDSYSFNDTISGTGYAASVANKDFFNGEALSGWYRVILRITFTIFSTRS
jgi:hypothetical protein